MRTLSFVAACFIASNAWADFADLQAQLDALLVKPPVVKVVKVDTGPVYNTVRTRANWSHPGRGKAAVINHLMSGQHRGKFTRQRLAAMTLLELEKLHSNDHEGRPYVVKTTTSKAVKSTRAEPYCPT